MNINTKTKVSLSVFAIIILAIVFYKADIYQKIFGYFYSSDFKLVAVEIQNPERFNFPTLKKDGKMYTKIIRMKIPDLSNLKKGDVFELSIISDKYKFEVDDITKSDPVLSEHIDGISYRIAPKDFLKKKFSVKIDIGKHDNKDVAYISVYDYYGKSKSIILYNNVGFYFDDNDLLELFNDNI